jgi:hypothetical protein
MWLDRVVDILFNNFHRLQSNEIFFPLHLNIKKLIDPDMPALSKPYTWSRGIWEICVNQLWLTLLGVEGVMNTVVGQSLHARSEHWKTLSSM